MAYGIELILDLHECSTRFSRETITDFMWRITAKEMLDMERADLHFWDYSNWDEKMAAPDHLAGTSAVQFITTSNITIHTLDKLKVVYLNIFTCSDLNRKKVQDFCRKYWQGRIVTTQLIERK